MQQQSTPKVSVLLPIYHTNEKHLRVAIESILNQSFKDFELLILNDSPENTSLGDLVASYDDARIRYLVNEQNKGITASRNDLIDLAHGEYLAVMDHDDISLPQRFEKQVTYMDANPDVGVVGTYAHSFPQPGHYPNRFETDKELKLALMTNCSIIHPTAMIRASLLNEHGLRYESEFSPAEDYALWSRLIPLTKFYNIPEVLFHYRWHRNSTTRTQKDKMRAAAYELHRMIRRDNPELYEEFLARATRKLHVLLFGFIPFLYLVKERRMTKVYLFGCILILKFKTTTKMK